MTWNTRKLIYFVINLSKLNGHFTGIRIKIRLGGIIIERSPDEQHEERSKLLPDSRNKVQGIKTDTERSTESQVQSKSHDIQLLRKGGETPSVNHRHKSPSNASRRVSKSSKLEGYHGSFPPSPKVYPG